MDHASHLVGTPLAGEAALAVALGLARLLLFLMAATCMAPAATAMAAAIGAMIKLSVLS